MLHQQTQQYTSQYNSISILLTIMCDLSSVIGLYCNSLCYSVPVRLIPEMLCVSIRCISISHGRMQNDLVRMCLISDLIEDQKMRSASAQWAVVVCWWIQWHKGCLCFNGRRGPCWALISVLQVCWAQLICVRRRVIVL